MELPKTINPCPIIDALLEIRFTIDTHPNAVFGLIYNSLKTDFPNVEKLPILQLPEAVRSKDPAFKFKPHYKIYNNTFVVQIGMDVLSISSYPEYVGWEVFSVKIFDIIENIKKLNIIKTVTRLGIRYINFFENNIFDQINLRLLFNQDTINYDNTVLRTEIVQGSFKSTLNIANNIRNKSKSGSVIDIDTFMNDGLEDFFQNKETLIRDGHNKEKELFYSLLKNNFLDSLNPEY